MSVNFRFRIIKYGVLVGIVALMLGLVGCTNNRTEKNEKQEYIRFSTLSQAEKQEYVKAYLKENYELNCDLTEIKTRQISAISNERDYSTIAETEDGFWFTVWITPRSEIKDTAFSYQLKDDVNSYFEKILKAQGIECVLIDRFYFDEYPSKQWKADEIEEMFAEENILNIIDLYISQENVDLKQIENALMGYQGAVYVHCGELERDNIDYEHYDYFIDLD